MKFKLLQIANRKIEKVGTKVAVVLLIKYDWLFA